MATSTAISDSIRTRAVGYQVLNQVFNPQTTNLPMRIALFGEANTANEAELDTTPFQPTSVKEIGDKYGYGSPLFQMGRILLPIFGGGVGAIPLVIYPQGYSVGATSTEIVLGVTAAAGATKTKTHTLFINGRDNIDGKRFDFTVAIDDTTDEIGQKIADTINNVLYAPCTAVAGVAGAVTVTSKWEGLTSAQLDISFETNGDSAGVVYAETSRTDGAETPDISGALNYFGNEWNTLVINPYSVESVLEILETANGTPESTTGRYVTTLFKPFVSFFGSTEDDKTTLTTLTNADARKDQVTNALCPAPKSLGFDYEAAANMCVLVADIANDSPHLGVGGMSYPDMPVPSDGLIGDMATLINRNFCMTRGCSTVLLQNGKYTVQDLVTTFFPDGVVSPKFQFVRDLILDWNIGYNWKIIVIRDIQDKTLVGDKTPKRVDSTISPKQIKALLIGMINNTELNALVTDVQFTKDSIVISINSSNPARLDIFFKYKRTSTANQVSTDAAVDFSYNL
ncbi:MAG: hypothetical protein PF486_06105 [Prolixibacteraceae bacterium]|jgi:phage tail sheath gpL-like|nr:hypothetical protein [Prolixibacteraceae bacterium]